MQSNGHITVDNGASRRCCFIITAIIRFVKSTSFCSRRFRLSLAHHSAAHSTKRNPVSTVSLVDDPIIKAPGHRVHAGSKFDITFTLDDGQTPIRLALEPNHNILHEDFTVTYVDNKGNTRESEPVPRDSHRVYKGRAFVRKDDRADWVHAGWARATVHKDGAKPIFEGAFRIHGNTHHIQTGAHYRRLKHEEDPTVDVPDNGEEIMVAYRDSDIRSSSAFDELKRDTVSARKCDSDSLGFNSRYDEEMRAIRERERSLATLQAKSLFGRQTLEGDMGDDAGANYIPSIGSTDGCPTTRKVALVGIATDCNYWSEFDQDREELRKNVIDLVNKASAVYEDTFSISLGIKNLTVTEQTCGQEASDYAPWNLACSDRVDLNDRLNLFSSWRGQHSDSNAYWTLLTTCQTESAVGLAWRGQLCREGASEANDESGNNETVAAANVVVRTSAEWQIFAHETGHTFGAVHDCTEIECPVSTNAQPCCPLSSSSCNADGKFIMNPSTGEGVTDFSPCSIGNICSGLSRNIDGDCLTDNRDVGTFTDAQCGNGIVEDGEDCDCGGADECTDNDCCNPDTCKFRDGAVCDPINEDCCTDQCQFASRGTVCRDSTGQCDPEETCAGDTGSCPDDNHLDDGDSCGDGLSCASGQCTSRDQQCRAMLGDGNENNDDIQSCGGNTCMLSCSSSNMDDGQCSLYNQNFLDGTSCGGGGRCNNGSCEGSSTWGQIQEWFRDNKDIAIPVGAAIGGLLVLAIAGCIFSSCRRKRRIRRAAKERALLSGNDSPVFTGAAGVSHHDQPPEYTYGQVPIDNPRFERTRSMRYA